MQNQRYTPFPVEIVDQHHYIQYRKLLYHDTRVNCPRRIKSYSYHALKTRTTYASILISTCEECNSHKGIVMDETGQKYVKCKTDIRWSETNGNV